MTVDGGARATGDGATRPPLTGAVGIPPRWFTETGADHSRWYVERFRGMAEDGADLDGEARLVDAMAPRGALLLDAGCGPGRVAGALHRRGHRVVGVDVDPVLIAAAGEDHPGPQWVVADLAVLDLPAVGLAEPFDGIVMAGNVLGFVAEGTEGDVLLRLATHLKPDGFLVIGLGTDRGYPSATMDRDARAAGLVLEHRFATWDVRAWRRDADFAVSVYRRPGEAS